MNLYSIFLKNLQIEKKIITENKEYSYRQIFNFVENTSNIIKKYKQNKRILLVSNNFFSYLILFYVCSKLGKTLIPVNSSLSKNQILSIYEFVKPDIVAFSNEYSFFKRYIKSDKLIPDINFYRGTGKKLTNIINEIMYTKDGLTLGRKFILESDVLHGIAYDYNKENIITASITDDWLYKIPLNDDPPISNTMDSLITTHVGNYPKRLQPLQIISLNDSLVAISCSGFMNDVIGQVQIWNIQLMKFVTSYEFDDKSIPWHLIKSPVSKEIFIVLSGSGGNGGLAALTYSENGIELKWETLDDNYMNLHGVTIDSNGEYIYVTSRGNHYLYQFRNMVEDGPLLTSVPLGTENQIVSPGGVSMMQKTCIECE